MLTFIKRHLLTVLAIFSVASLIYLTYKTIDTTYEDVRSVRIYTNDSMFVESRFKDRIDFYESSLKALASNRLLSDYVIDGRNKAAVQGLFLHIKKSLPDLFQIRFLDRHGMEKIRAEGQAISLYGEQARSYLTNEELLQDKSHKPYFKQFIKLEPYTIGLSPINLNRDHGKITLPKEPTIRMGIPIYGDKQSVQGVVILNVSLRYLFKRLVQSTLYNISLSDGEGRYLFHYDTRYGLTGDDFDYSVRDAFPLQYETILGSSRYESANVYSRKIQGFENGQQMILMLERKEQPVGFITLLQNDNLVMISSLLTVVIVGLLIFLTKIKRRRDEKHTDS
jgi:hypothetical protein